MSQHTPGPWKIAGPVGAGIWITDESSNNQIAMVYGERQTPGASGNARLIAVAPDLLAALLKAEPFIADELETRSASFLPNPSTDEGVYLNEAQEALDAVRVAIAKAEDLS